MTDTRVCKLCNVEKPLDEMAITNTARNSDKVWYKNVCKPCDAHLTKTTTRLRKVIPKPGPDYLCPICDKPSDRMHLDHDWKTDEFRGWLCSGCNTGLGRFNDDVDLLKKAAEYLMRTGSNADKVWNVA